MKRKRHTPEQIIRKLRNAEQLLNHGQSVADVCRTLEVSGPTYHRWQQLYGGMKATEAKRLKELEQENSRLKRLLADAELDKAMLKELAEGNFLARNVAAGLLWSCRIDSGFHSGEPAGWQARTAPHNAGPCRWQPSRSRSYDGRRIRELARRHVRWGRRLVYRRLRLEGWSVNHKRVQRIWREEGLQRPLPRRRKRARPTDGSRELLRAEYPHHVWAIDFQFDQRMDGRMLKFLNVIDEFSRVFLAIRVG